MTTKTITITDLADVQEGDMVTAEYVPPTSVSEFGATIIGQANTLPDGALRVGRYVLRRKDGSCPSALLFISATREVPAWEPDAAYVRYLAQALAAASGAPASEWECWRAVATPMLTHMHDSGWLKDDPADPKPVDPVLDETDKRDRIDCDGDKWHWSEYNAVWVLNTYTAGGNLATLDRHYGPLRFADKDDEDDE